MSLTVRAVEMRDLSALVILLLSFSSLGLHLLMMRLALPCRMYIPLDLGNSIADFQPFGIAI